MNKRNLAAVLTPVLDPLLVVPTALAALVLKGVRRFGLERFRLCRAVLMRIGVLPIRSHYYEPFVVAARLRQPLDAERRLPGIDWNLAEQLRLLDSLRCEHELTDLSDRPTTVLDYRLGNGSFEAGDAEYLYQLLRLKKPRRLFEIGSGHSTLIARRALLKNRDAGAECKHLCIEPFEAPWLERTGVITLRQRLEEVDRTLFEELEENDVLFIDSSHIIRPQGDVLTEYLEILPLLSPGVIVHVHDIFSPRDYPREWVVERMRLWNEQYLLEAFLTGNDSWKILGAVNLLKHRHFEALSRVCPYLTPDREPGSFYLQRLR
jgi:Methyltransferase domain